MIYLALGAVALAFLVWMGGRKPLLKRREWRFISGAFSIVTFAGAAFAGLRGAWEPTIVLVVLGLWSAVSTRSAGQAASPKAGSKMSLDEACSILGVGPDATAAEIKAAYTRLMRLAHPDTGGTTGLASQLNAARDRLLRK
jgi:hypothetical protein